MGLELDRLKNNDNVCVIYNNTTGQVEEFYAGNDFIKVLFKEFTVLKDYILKYFSKEEIEEFFDENNMDLEGLKEVL